MHGIAIVIALLPGLVFAQAPKAKKATPATPAKPAAAKPVGKSAFDKATLESYLRHQFLLPANLKVIVDDPKPSDLPSMQLVDVTVTDGAAMRQQVQFYVSSDGTRLVQGKVFDIRESPFAGDLKLLKTAGQPHLGPANAPVTIVVFSDFQCQYCREEAKTLRGNLNGAYGQNVQGFFKDFPLEQIHAWAKPAAIIGRCIYRANAEKFWEFHDWIFENQAMIIPETLKPKALEFANSKGLDTLQLTQCIDAKATEKDVEANANDARGLQITSTPTLFVNGRRMIGNVPWDQLKNVLDYELDYAKKNPPKKDEACCEIQLAIPVLK
jgi:protein-disulfide isomerase